MEALKAMARPIREIADAIQRQDTKWLSTLPGIGPTTAEQIVTTLKRKVAPFLMASTPASESDAAETTAVVETKLSGKRKPAPEAPPASNLPDGRLIEDVYEALMGLGLTPMEARIKLDGLLTSGKPFKTLEEAITIVFSNKG